MVRLATERKNGIYQGDRMTIQQLKYIIGVAETGSITEAAKALFVSQPSLSNAIKEIEKEAGLTVFTRSRQGIALTKEGLEFLGYPDPEMLFAPLQSD